MKSDIPIIKLFINGNKYFFYDAYKNQVLNISKKQFFEINELIKIGLNSYILLKRKDQEYLDIMSLINKGYLKSEFIEEILHPETRYIKNLIDRGLNDLTLQVTKDCNFKCRYCSFTREHKLDRNHEKVNMSWQIAKGGIDFLYNHSKDSDVISLSFYGGEPMLNFDLIEKAVLYAHQLFKSKKVNFYMTFNASVLTQYMINFLIKYQFNILISLDGPATIQNKHRKFSETGNDTFSIVMSNINRLKQTDFTYFKNYVSFAPVVFIDERLTDVLSFFASIGVDEDKISYTYANMSGIDYMESDIYRNTTKPKQYYFEDKEERKILDKFQDKTPLPPIWHPYGPCIPGFTKLFLDTYGDFYPCEKVIASPLTKIGSIFNGIDLKKVEKHMNIGKLSEEDCKNCWAIRYCEMCIVRCIDLEKDCLSKEQKQKVCNIQKNNIEKYMRKIMEKY